MSGKVVVRHSETEKKHREHLDRVYATAYHCKRLKQVLGLSACNFPNNAFNNEAHTIVSSLQ